MDPGDGDDREQYFHKHRVPICKEKNRFMKLEIENNIFSSALILYEFFHTTIFSSNVTTEQCSDSNEIVFITAYVSK